MIGVQQKVILDKHEHLFYYVLHVSCYRRNFAGSQPGGTFYSRTQERSGGEQDGATVRHQTGLHHCGHVVARHADDAGGQLNQTMREAQSRDRSHFLGNKITGDGYIRQLIQLKQTRAQYRRSHQAEDFFKRRVIELKGRNWIPTAIDNINKLYGELNHTAQHDRPGQIKRVGFAVPVLATDP